MIKTPDIGDKQVTERKLADGSVTSSKLSTEIANMLSLLTTRISAFKVADNLSSLPTEENTIGWLVDNHLYVYVGNGSTPESGMYQDCGELRGPQGIQGEQGLSGLNGKSAYDIWTEQPGNEDKSEIDFLEFTRGSKGDKGDQGERGYDISNIEQLVKSTEDGGKNIIRVTRSDGWSKVFEILNGSKGSKGDKGTSIVKLEQTRKTTESSGLNTIEATLGDGTKESFEIYNGAKGEQGDKGDKGDKGDQGESGPQGNSGIADASNKTLVNDAITGGETDFLSAEVGKLGILTYDCSKGGTITHATLQDAINSVPTTFQKVGLTITFKSGNTIYRYSLKANAWSSDPVNWFSVEDKLSDLRNNVNEFNVSKIYPKDGLDKEGAEGGNMYSLKSAISKVKSYIKTGERLSFINLSGKPEIWEYYYTSGNMEDLNNWINIGGDEISRINKCVNTNTISINGNKQVINITEQFSSYSLFVPKGRKVKVSITNFEAEDSISIACSVTFLDGSNKQIANFGNYGSTVYIAEKEVERIEFYDNKNNLISAEITITVNEEGIEGRVLTLENSISSSSAKVNILEEAVKSKLNKKTKLSDYCNILLGKDIENGKIVENESKKIVQLPYKLIPDEGLLSMNNDRTITQKSASNQMLITDENLNIIQVIHYVNYYLITTKSKSIIDNNLDKKLYLNVVYNINDEIPLRPFIDNSYIINGLGDNIADDYYIRSTNLINFDNRAMANIDSGNVIFQSNTSGLYIWGVKLDSKENLYCNTKATAGGTAKLYKLDPSKGYIFYSNVAIITPDTTLGKHVNVMIINIEDVDIDDITNMYLIFRHQGAATFPCIVSKNPFMPDSDYYIVNPKYIGLPNKLNALILGDSYSSLGHWITYLTKYIRITGLVNVAVVGASIRDFGQENPNMNLCGQADTIESYVTKGIIYTDENEYPDIIILQGGENEGPDSDEVFSKYNTQFSKVVNAYVKKNDTAVLQNVSVPTPLSEVNKKTFAGAYRYIAEKLLTLFPRAQLFITSVTRLGYINTSNLGEYREKEAIQQRTIAARMSVPFIDFAGLSGINDIFNYPRGSGTKDDPYTNGPARDTFDSMHPNYNDNASGASKLGQVAANCIKSNIIKLSK